jgi:hypothetical protein
MTCFWLRVADPGLMSRHRWAPGTRCGRGRRVGQGGVGRDGRRCAAAGPARARPGGPWGWPRHGLGARHQGDVADPGVQPHAVGVAGDHRELGAQGGRVADGEQVGYSALTWPNSDSIQAWSVGVPGRPKCWWMADKAMNSPGGARGHLRAVVAEGQQDRPLVIVQVQVQGAVQARGDLAHEPSAPTPARRRPGPGRWSPRPRRPHPATWATPDPRSRSPPSWPW